MADLDKIIDSLPDEVRGELRRVGLKSWSSNLNDLSDILNIDMDLCINKLYDGYRLRCIDSVCEVSREVFARTVHQFSKDPNYFRMLQLYYTEETDTIMHTGLFWHKMREQTGYNSLEVGNKLIQFQSALIILSSVLEEDYVRRIHWKNNGYSRDV